mmetsp:Transcript_23224/g.32821  ORF Transcript_23224/g.32821 Transcript_23224/m.32821 type:complete len:124 (+) Transcript_23224:27-398(+)|eukprot:CAMPEP_0175092254 /NCGR_PEP_ID=MMETSP0086_2-20121207/2363_1 /TAXON_ID=136419 /ORGANISM="Unknown Unknown, Strain D1" /LENGTH=123 /DNA_ID=CAMNT_0016365101 /DNA_START=27 /DNA_END=398 /DNA_ORIENTATION=+
MSAEDQKAADKPKEATEGCCSRNMRTFKHAAYHKEEDGLKRDLYFFNDCDNWKKICAAQWALWIGVGFFTYLLVALSIEYNDGFLALWVYLILFCGFLVVLVSTIMVGNVERGKQVEFVVTDD